MTFLYQAGEIPDASSMGEWDSYTPDLQGSTGDPNLGADGEAHGGWQRIGPRLVWGWFWFRLRGTGVSMGSGTWFVTVPVAIDSSAVPVGDGVVPHGSLGAGWVFRNAPTGSSPRQLGVFPIGQTSTLMRFHLADQTVTAGAGSTLQSTSPVLASATDVVFRSSFLYQIVPGT